MHTYIHTYIHACTGMIDILNYAGIKLLARGIGTEFVHSRVTYAYRDLKEAKKEAKEGKCTYILTIHAYIQYIRFQIDYICCC